MDNPRSYEPAILLAFVCLFLVASGIDPVADRYTWMLETTPVIIGIMLLVPTRGQFPLTPLLYRLLALHALILMIGGYYTYAEVPLFNWLRDSFELSRNHYDRIGQRAQGFIPAILAREILLRRSPLQRGKWLFLIITSICLAFSALYEMIEWWTALLSAEAAASFLGTQGDQWDTQWDMFLAMTGAIFAQIMLNRIHDRELNQITGNEH